MVTGPSQGRLSIAVRPIRPAHVAGRPRPVFTEITCALATPARYSTPRRPANWFLSVWGALGRYTTPGARLSWDRATRAGGVNDKLAWIRGTGVRARGDAGLRHRPGSCRRGAEIGIRRWRSEERRVGKEGR